MRNRPNSSSALESLAESAYADVFELLHTGIARYVCNGCVPLLQPGVSEHV